ncbi:putative armadillo-like helical, importin beta family [Helianthus anomalus]
MDFCSECLESKDEELIDTATRTLAIMKNRPEDEDQDKKVDIPSAGRRRTVVLQNISKPDWLSCAAVTWSFLDGRSFEELSEKVDFDLEILLDAMKEQKTRMKDGVEWTLSCILMLLHTPATGLPVILPKLPQMSDVLLGSIKDSPDVAERACGVIYYLAHGYSCSETTSLSALEPYLSDIVTSLTAAAERNDANLSCAAYETLQEVVRCSDPVKSLEATAPVLRFFLNKFAKTLRLPIDSTRKLDLLAKICGGMQVTIEKLSGSNDGKHVISEVADKIMTLLPKVFIYKIRSATVLEKAMLAIGALARATGPEFRKYMQEFYQHLETGLDNMEENKVCSASVEVASDICRALGYRVLPFCSDLVPVLFRNLCSRKLHRSAKPLIYSCFGDIALAIGIYFEEHVLWVMRMMRDAADECAQRIDREYGEQLKRSVLKAYFAILQGCKRSKPEILEPHAPQILKFVEVVVKDANNRYVF